MNHLEAVSRTIFPPWTTLVVNLGIQKIFDIARERFQWRETPCVVLSSISSGVVAAWLVDRYERHVFPEKNKLENTAFYLNIAINILIACIRFYQIERTSQNTNESLTNLHLNKKRATFRPLESQDEHIKTIEKILHRSKESTGMLFVGDDSLTNLLINECAGRIENNALAKDSPLSGKTFYSIHASTINKMWLKSNTDEMLNSLSRDPQAILVIYKSHLLDKENVDLLVTFISQGKVTVFGTTSLSERTKIQEDLNPWLTEHDIGVIDAAGCHEAIQNAFPTLPREVQLLASLFSFNHVSKSFSIVVANALLKDFIYLLKKPMDWTQENFRIFWEKQYLKSRSKISLSSLSESSKEFFNKENILIDDYDKKILSLNKQKGDARLGSSEMPVYMTDMNEAAREGRYAPCIGREEEIKIVVRTLLKPKQKSLVLLGEPGIGKTAVFEEIARRIATNDDSVKRIKDMTLYWVDVNILSSHDGVVGRLEGKITSMTQFCKLREGKAVLVIDELHQLRGTGRYKGNDKDILEMLKNSLARDEIIVMGTANNNIWNPLIVEDPAIERRFGSLHMLPPTKEACFDMLTHINQSGFYTQHFAQPLVKVTDGAIKAAIEWSEFWQPDKFLPDKATVLISTAISKYQIEQEELESFEQVREINPREIATVLHSAIKYKPKIPALDVFLSTVLKKQPDLTE